MALTEVPGVGAIARALADVLGDRLESVVVYGSAATGDLLEGYSDLDLLILVNGTIDANDALRLHELVVDADVTAFSSVQPSFSRPESAWPLLVEGAFDVIAGRPPPPNAFQTDEDLSANGEEWLGKLPGLVRRDLVDWSLAAVDAHRRARLALTRLKPAIRALLVRDGTPPMTAWSATWDVMVARLEAVDHELAETVGNVLTAVRSGSDPHSVGAAAARSLLRVCAFLSADGESVPLAITEEL